jgi:hypothetical protein
MVRLFLPLFLLAWVSLLGAQTPGRTDVLWREYLSETVRRGLPLLSTDPLTGVVPFWPTLDRARADALSLEPGPDTELLSGWMDLQEGAPDDAAAVLKARWPHPGLSRFPARYWGEALFASWDPSDPAWIQAWLAWDDKAYSAASLVRGIEGLEKTDPSAVAPLLDQALRLYPDDRRFLPLVSRHPGVAVSSEGLLARDRANMGGWSAATLAALLTRAPQSRDLLLRAGYPAPVLDAAASRDYGAWLKQPADAVLTEGRWTWDSDQDGVSESVLTVQSGHLVTWTRASQGGLWTLSLAGGKPQIVTETRHGAVWTLKYEAYPWVQSLEYRWADTTLVYRFRPLAESVPLWPPERFSAPVERLPAALAALWLPLDPAALASQAASVETWEGPMRVQTVHLFHGEVWLEVEDSNRDGRDDTWSYFRSGRLASVYRDLEGRGQVSLRELYRQGEIAQVQARSNPGPRAEFVLFPAEGVQLWDPRGTGRPLDRVFAWSGHDRLDALVFSGTELPWETMPPWEPRP